jgi:hypothetical protein
MEKRRPKVAFLISGQSRDSYIGTGADQRIYQSHKQHIFNSELEDNYDYDVYIVTDNTTYEKCLNFFEKHLKKIKNIDQNEVKIKEGLVGTNNQYHKLYIAWKLMEETGLHYDYVVKLRPDVIIFHDFPPFLLSLDKKLEQEIIFSWDVIFVGRYDIMREICNIYNTLYRPYSPVRYNFKHNGLMTYKVYYIDWNAVHTPEVQLCECAMAYITAKGKSITESLIDGKIDFQLRNESRHFTNNHHPNDYYSRDDIHN